MCINKRRKVEKAHQKKKKFRQWQRAEYNNLFWLFQYLDKAVWVPNFLMDICVSLIHYYPGVIPREWSYQK